MDTIPHFLDTLEFVLRCTIDAATQLCIDFQCYLGKFALCLFRPSLNPFQYISEHPTSHDSNIR